MRERGGERESERQRQRDRDRETETDRDRQRQTDRQGNKEEAEKNNRQKPVEGVGKKTERRQQTKPRTANQVTQTTHYTPTYLIWHSVQVFALQTIPSLSTGNRTSLYPRATLRISSAIWVRRTGIRTDSEPVNHKIDPEEVLDWRKGNAQTSASSYTAL